MSTTPDARAGADRVALIVVNYASSALLAEHLAGAGVLDRVDDVVVVDNPSSADERRALRELCRANGWELVEPPRNDGFGAGVKVLKPPSLIESIRQELRTASEQY